MTDQIEKQALSVILIVDDEPGNIRILVELLRPYYTTRVAVNGETALRIATSDNPPDLVLLDIMMPGMDGYEVCRRLKADPCTQHIPVIFITAKDSEEDQITGFETGAVDYVTKPFSPVIVKARVKTHVELKKLREFYESLSLRDGLTCIANRRRFDEYLSATWNLAKRESSPLSLVLIDIDHFKFFNDNYGHKDGDACLIRVAQTLGASLRRSVDLMARYGGEEFGCILPNTTLDGAMAMAERFRECILALQIPHAGSPTADYLTISQGVATVIPSSDSSPDNLIKAADAALYRSKTT
ncbi:MAG: diguanylate cyclase, partial [Deltaproteobacteria bacterium]|nr:diguanylate cyclase [Deltaproteobacteria bacterium]